MTASATNSQVPQSENKTNDKELNFRALEAKYQKQVDFERAGRLEAERVAQEAISRHNIRDDDDSSDEPYIVPKTLEKKLAKFGQTQQSEIQKAMEMAKHAAKEELRQEVWLENHPDFFDIIEKNANNFQQKAPKLAAAILKMPEGFERQKLVYETLKEMGIDKPEQKQASIQDKVDANRRSPYYQPSGVGAAPYAAAGDFSASGQKNAHAKMQEMKKRLSG
jgi:hypothetical protein